MPYPRLDREEKLSCKLSCGDIEQIKKEHAKGHKITDIADSFLVSSSTIKYWVDPLYRHQRIQSTIRCIMKRIRTDPAYRKRVYSYHVKNQVNRYKNKPLFREWTSQICKVYNASHRQEKRDYMKEWRKRKKNS